MAKRAAKPESAPVSTPKPKTVAELLKELPDDALNDGADVAICELYIIMKQLDPELQFEKLFGQCYSGMGDKAVRLAFPSIIVADKNLTVDAQAAAYAEMVELLDTAKDFDMGMRNIVEVLGELADEKSKADDKADAKSEPKDDPKPSGKGAKEEKADDEPKPSGKGSKGGKGSKEAKEEKADDEPKPSGKGGKKGRTTPEEDAEFEQKPQTNEPADLEITVPAAKLDIAQGILGKPSKEKEGEILAHVAAKFDDDQHRVVLAVTANAERTYVDGYIHKVDAKKTLVCEVKGMHYDLLGRFEFEFPKGKTFVVETFPEEK